MTERTANATVYTIGHGSRSISELVELLGEAGIACVIDVRAYPASRRHPHFGREALEKSLAQVGIRYLWEGRALGGRRRSVKASPHTELTSKSFRAYADHMMTVAYREGLKRVIKQGLDARTAILCAERLPWECHRNLIADSLVARGYAVMHLIGPSQTRAHALNEVARSEGEDLIYDAAEQLDLGLPPSSQG